MTDRDTILVCGSREWRDETTMLAWIMPWLKRDDFGRLVHGGASGADDMADSIAREYIWSCTRRVQEYLKAYPVDTSIDGPWPAAGPKRNARMLAAELPRIRRVLAFTTPGPRCGMTKGTADMVDRCVRAGLPVTIVTPGNRP